MTTGVSIIAARLTPSVMSANPPPEVVTIARAPPYDAPRGHVDRRDLVLCLLGDEPELLAMNGKECQHRRRGRHGIRRYEIASAAEGAGADSLRAIQERLGFHFFIRRQRDADNAICNQGFPCHIAFPEGIQVVIDNLLPLAGEVVAYIAVDQLFLETEEAGYQAGRDGIRVYLSAGFLRKPGKRNIDYIIAGCAVITGQVFPLTDDDGPIRYPTAEMVKGFPRQWYQDVNAVNHRPDAVRGNSYQCRVVSAPDTGHVFFCRKKMIAALFQDPCQHVFDRLDALSGLTGKYDGYVVLLGRILSHRSPRS